MNPNSEVTGASCRRPGGLTGSGITQPVERQCWRAILHRELEALGEVDAQLATLRNLLGARHFAPGRPGETLWPPPER